MHKLESLINSSPVPFCIIDQENGEVLVPGMVMERKLGYTKKELSLLSKNLFQDIIHPKDYSVTKCIKKQLYQSKEHESVEAILRLRHSMGHFVSFHMHCAVLERNENSDIKSCTVFANDLTDLHQTQVKLSEALKKIEEIRFTNSHELRAPVANIKGIVNLLNSTKFYFEHQEYLIHLLNQTVNKLDLAIMHVNEVASSE